MSVLIAVTSARCLVSEGAFGTRDAPFISWREYGRRLFFLEVLLCDTTYGGNQITGYSLGMGSKKFILESRL